MNRASPVGLTTNKKAAPGALTPEGGYEGDNIDHAITLLSYQIGDVCQVKMPTPKQLPSGAWRVQLRANGGVISVTRDNPDVAVSDALAIRAGIKEKEVVPKDRIKLTDAITEYINNRVNILSPATIRGYKIIQENRMNSIMGKPVCDIDLEAIQAAINEDAKKYSAKTIQNTVGLILSVLAKYKDIHSKKLRYPQKIRKEHKFLDAEEIIKLVAGCEGDKAEVPILLAVWLGLRRSEIFGLHWESIDFENKKIRIERSLVMGAGSEYFEKNQMKNESSRRVLSCPDYILEKLNQYQPDKDLRVGQVFKMNPDTIYKRLTIICRDCGIEFVGVHGLRHTNASVMLSLGVVDKVAMARGGWATNNTMKDIYQHVFNKDKETANDVINDYFEALVEKASHEMSHEK